MLGIVLAFLLSLVVLNLRFALTLTLTAAHVCPPVLTRTLTLTLTLTLTRSALTRTISTMLLAPSSTSTCTSMTTSTLGVHVDTPACTWYEYLQLWSRAGTFSLHCAVRPPNPCGRVCARAAAAGAHPSAIPRVSSPRSVAPSTHDRSPIRRQRPGSRSEPIGSIRAVRSLPCCASRALTSRDASPTPPPKPTAGLLALPLERAKGALAPARKDPHASGLGPRRSPSPRRLSGCKRPADDRAEMVKRALRGKDPLVRILEGGCLGCVQEMAQVYDLVADLRARRELPTSAPVGMSVHACRVLLGAPAPCATKAEAAAAVGDAPLWGPTSTSQSCRLRQWLDVVGEEEPRGPRRWGQRRAAAAAEGRKGHTRPPDRRPTRRASAPMGRTRRHRRHLHPSSTRTHEVRRAAQHDVSLHSLGAHGYGAPLA